MRTQIDKLGRGCYVFLEKRIRISTQGRITIPKKIRESLKISDGQAVVVRSAANSKEIVIELLPTITEFK